MSDLYEQVSQERGKLESLLGQIPGYRGYKEKEMRREADKLLRDTIARRLEEQRRRLPDLQKRLLSGGGITWLDDVESAQMKLQTFIDRVKTATYGYAGFFDAVRVKEDALDELYTFDEALLATVDEIRAAIDGLEAAIGTPDKLGEAIAALNRAAAKANETFERRADVITGTTEL